MTNIITTKQDIYMRESGSQEEISDTRKYLGIAFVLIALLGVYWVAEAIIQLWSSPKSVPLVSMFIDLLEENQKPLILNPAQESGLNLPAPWPVVVGVFLSIVLISSVILLIKSLLESGLLLLFPGIHDKKGVVATAIQHVIGRRNEQP